MVGIFPIQVRLALPRSRGSPLALVPLGLVKEAPGFCIAGLALQPDVFRRAVTTSNNEADTSLTIGAFIRYVIPKLIRPEPETPQMVSVCAAYRANLGRTGSGNLARVDAQGQMGIIVITVSENATGAGIVAYVQHTIQTFGIDVTLVQAVVNPGICGSKAVGVIATGDSSGAGILRLMALSVDITFIDTV